MSGNNAFSFPFELQIIIRYVEAQGLTNASIQKKLEEIAEKYQ